MMLISQITRIYHSIEFDCLERSCDFVSRSLQNAADEISRNYERELLSVDEDHRDVYADVLSEEHNNYEKVYPKIQWDAYFLLSFGMFESTLNSYCRIAGHDADSNLTLNDLSGQGIERAKNYLSKVVGVEGCFNSSEWSYIRDASKIRNIIAHTSGTLNFDNSIHCKVADMIKKTEGVQLICEHDAGADILLSKEYVVNTIRTFRQFIRNIGVYDTNS